MKDDDEIGAWKDGFHLRCGVPTTLLVEAMARGPWSIVNVTGARKHPLCIARTGSLKWTLEDIRNDRVPVAWVGGDTYVAMRICERLNGYEMARDFPLDRHHGERMHPILEHKLNRADKDAAEDAGGR